MDQPLPEPIIRRGGNLKSALQKRVDDAPVAGDDRLEVAGRILAGYLREKGLKQSAKRLTEFAFDRKVIALGVWRRVAIVKRRIAGDG